jgi:DNA-binding IclR family transcriptional regulator
MNQLDPARSTPAIGTETVDLSLRLLEFLALSTEPFGLSELARQFQASKATLHRHLHRSNRPGLAASGAD